MIRNVSALGFMVIALLGSGSARADPPPELRHDWAVDGAITGAGAVLWIGSEALFKHQLAPQSCRWCDRDPEGNDTLDGFDRGVRDALVWPHPATADTLSNVSAFALLPLTALGGAALAAQHDGAARNIPSDLLVIGESAMLAQDLNQAVKFAVGRERPFVHRLGSSEKPLTAHPDDNNLSFFSGHTTWSFSLATAAGTVCSMHGYKFAPYVWLGGLTFATATGLLRIGADKHYATDVITGALVGTAFGIGVPRLLHKPGQGSSPVASSLGLGIQPLAAGGVFAVSGRF